MVGVGGEQGPGIVDHEDVGGVRLADVAVDVEHEGIRRPRQVGLDLGQDVVDHVVVVDLGVDARGGVAPLAGRDQDDSVSVVVRGGALGGLPLGQHDEGGPVHVEGRVHGRGALLPPRQGEADVRPVPHPVSGQGAEDSLPDLGRRVDVLEAKGPGRAEEAAEVLLQAQDPAPVHPEALPARVSALDGGVPGAETRRLAGQDPSAPLRGRRPHPHQQVLVARVFVHLGGARSPGAVRRGQAQEAVVRREGGPEGFDQRRPEGAVGPP